MKTNPKLIICASHSSLEERVRLNKLKYVLDEHKLSYQLWGWARNHDLPALSYPVKYLWKGGGFSNKSLFLHYPLWIISIFLSALRLKKNDLVYAVALDVAIPVYLASRIRRFKFIFDNPDNFSLTYNLKGKFKKIIDGIETRVAKNALYHILPVEGRFKPKHNNILIIPNFPLKSELDKAKSLVSTGQLRDVNFNKLNTDSRFKIYINGRMVKQRGSEWIARVISTLAQDEYLIIVAGDVYCKTLSATLDKIDNVVRFPNLSNFEALALYKCADIVLAFYDPALPINRKAAPNKWWDCVALETPFISNEEIETLTSFLKMNSCFTVPYDADQELINLLDTLKNDPQKLNIIKQNMKKLQLVSWDKNLGKIISTINLSLN